MLRHHSSPTIFWSAMTEEDKALPGRAEEHGRDERRSGGRNKQRPSGRRRAGKVRLQESGRTTETDKFTMSLQASFLPLQSPQLLPQLRRHRWKLHRCLLIRRFLRNQMSSPRCQEMVSFSFCCCFFFLLYNFCFFWEEEKWEFFYYVGGECKSD